MAIGRLYLSHCNYDFSKLDVKRLTKKNLKKILQSDEINDCCTSIEDSGLKIGEIDQELLCHCKAIECLDITWDSIINTENHDCFVSVAYLLSTKYKNITTGLEQLHKETLSHCNYARSVKKTNKETLWVAGCSWSAATGVEPHERWGRFVADHFGREEVNLAVVGGSFWDAQDQLLRADIKEGDLVVWGLTSVGRIEAIKQNKLCSHPFQQSYDFDYYKKGYLFSNTQYATTIRQVQQVISCMEKIKAKLYMINFLEHSWIRFMLKNNKNFLDLRPEFDDNQYKFIMTDYGTDGVHPGPKQHQKYAEKIINFIKETNNVE